MKPLRYCVLAAVLLPTIAAGQSPYCTLQETITRTGQEYNLRASFSLSPALMHRMRQSFTVISASAASDSDFRLIEDYCEFWDADLAEWRNDHRHTYTYDAAGNLSEEVRWGWGWNGLDAWQVGSYVTFSYDASGREIEALYREVGIGEGRRLSSYDDAGFLAEKITQRWNGTGWDNWVRRLYEYYDFSHEAAGNLYQEIRQLWDSGEWVNRNMTRYLYDGSLLVETEEWGSEMNLPWWLNDRTSYVYDEAGNLSEELTQDSDGVSLSRATFSYDAAGNNIEAFFYEWDNDAAQWLATENTTSTFDGAGNRTVWLRREWNPDTEQWTDSDRCTWIWEAVAVAAEGDGSLPSDFWLSQNYPNPFNPTTTISYALPEAADVTLSVYDLLGRQIEELASGTKPAGTYEVSFDAAGLPSGVYFYRLHAGDFGGTKTMALVK